MIATLNIAGLIAIPVNRPTLLPSIPIISILHSPFPIPDHLWFLPDVAGEEDELLC